MIIFYTVFTQKTGMGNYMRCKQLLELILKHSDEAFMYVQTEQDETCTEHPKIELGEKQVIRNKLIELIGSREVYLVSDFPNLEHDDAQLHRHENIKKIFCLNDATVHQITPHVYFNTDKIVQPPIYSKNFVGLEYQIINNQILGLAKHNKSSTLKTIGVMFGGTDPGYLTEYFINELKNNNFFEQFNILIMLGINFDIKRRKKLIKHECRNIRFVGHKYLEKFYSEIDVLVNMGGMSTYEALYLHIPVCSVSWSYMEKYVLEQVNGLNTYALGDIKESAKQLEHLLVQSKNTLLSQSNFSNIDGLGARRITEIILEECDLV